MSPHTRMIISLKVRQACHFPNPHGLHFCLDSTSSHCHLCWCPTHAEKRYHPFSQLLHLQPATAEQNDPTPKTGARTRTWPAPGLPLRLGARSSAPDRGFDSGGVGDDPIHLADRPPAPWAPTGRRDGWGGGLERGSETNDLS